MIFFQLSLERFIACMREEMQFEGVCLKGGNVGMRLVTLETVARIVVHGCYAVFSPYFMHAHM